MLLGAPAWKWLDKYADAAPFQNAQVYLAKFAFATDVTFTEKYEGSTDGMVQAVSYTHLAGRYRRGH